MITYISILRGINVSGKRTIKMDSLEKLCEDLGFKNVQTYIQSGNVIFRDMEQDHGVLEKKISGKISELYGFDVPVIVLNTAELKQILDENPFIHNKSYDEAYLHLTFLSESPVTISSLETKKNDFLPEEFRIINKTVYLYCPNGYGRAKLTNSYLENKLKCTATTRNLKTANELLRLTDMLETRDI